MLISYSHRFIFIHVFKVAGTSVTEALAPVAQATPAPSSGSRIPDWIPARLARRLGRPAEKPVVAHITAKALRERIPQEQFDGFYKFAFVRNPWDWQVSLYTYMLQNQKHRQHQLIKAMDGFESYIEWRVANDVYFQKEFVTDSGNLIVDFIGRFENLTDDFARVCRRIGVSVPLPHSNRSGRRDYREYYNDRTAQMVADTYRDDIELFGYDFNGVRAEPAAT